ncbi:MAG: hypothetical protein Q9218_002594 [Villophora microphyllina]
MDKAQLGMDDVNYPPFSFPSLYSPHLMHLQIRLRRYRSNYSFKDPKQSHILALKIPHTHFHHILSQASVTPGHGKTMTADEKAKPVRVQWDPERSVDMKVLPYRSIQIGISGEVAREWVDWIERIEDVTDVARRLKRAVDEGDLDGIGEEEPVRRGLAREERVYEVDEELRKILEMDVG